MNKKYQAIWWGLIGLFAPVILWFIGGNLLFPFINPFGYILALNYFEYNNIGYLIAYSLSTALLYFGITFAKNKIKELKNLKNTVVTGKNQRFPYVFLFSFILIVGATLVLGFAYFFIGFLIYGTP